MDRKAWIAITLSVVGLVAWQWYVSKYITPAQQAAAGREVPDDCGLRLIVVCATGRRTLLRRNGCRKKP